MNEVLNTEVISKQDSFCIRIQESFKNMNYSNDCEDISSILAEFEEYVKSDQQAEIERLTEENKKLINLNITKKQVIDKLTGRTWCDYEDIPDYYQRYLDAEKRVNELTERLEYFQKSSDYHEDNQKELEIRNADLQKQVEKYKDEAITFKCEYEHQKDLLESKEEDYIVLDTLNTELQKQMDELKKRISKTYKVVTLCGSTRFKDTFIREQKRLTLEGNIVISVGLFGHSGDDEAFNAETKTMLDDMHKRKIDLSDEIFVINENGYIGTSTKSEIEYAKANGKVIKYLVEVK